MSLYTFASDTISLIARLTDAGEVSYRVDAFCHRATVVRLLSAFVNIYNISVKLQLQVRHGNDTSSLLDCVCNLINRRRQEVND